MALDSLADSLERMTRGGLHRALQAAAISAQATMQAALQACESLNVDEALAAEMYMRGYHAALATIAATFGTRIDDIVQLAPSAEPTPMPHAWSRQTVER